METDTKDSGMMTRNLERESTSGPTEIDTKEIGWKIDSTDKETSSGKLELLTTDSSKKTKEKIAMLFSFGPMETNTKDLSSQI